MDSYLKTPKLPTLRAEYRAIALAMAFGREAGRRDCPLRYGDRGKSAGGTLGQRRSTERRSRPAIDQIGSGMQRLSGLFAVRPQL